MEYFVTNNVSVFYWSFVFRLIKGLNLMIEKSVKSADFDADFTVFVDFDADFVHFIDFGLKRVKLTISFHSTVRIQEGNINFFF